MKKELQLSTAILVLFITATAAFAGVTVSSPSSGSTVGSSVNFVASATTSCSKGVAAMGIYPSANWLVYTTSGSHLNTNINLNTGSYNAVIVAWDNCGGSSAAGVKINVQAGSGVHVTSPANNSTVGSTVNYVATATTTCSRGVSAMGIYNGNTLAYSVGGASLNHSLSLSPGTYKTTVIEWDNCGGAATTPITITVNSGGKTFYNIQKAGGWQSYGQQPPNFTDCTSCSGLSWAMYQNIGSPSLSGSSTQYKIGGTTPYSDVLFLNHLIGPFSSQGLPDTSQTIVPTLHNFTYDVYFWGSNLGAAEGLEFDVNQFFNGMGFTFGHECMIAWRQEWDVWDAANFKWVPTGIPCKPNNNAWNHLVIQVSRTSSNQMYYKSITLNGVTYNVNRTYGHFSAPGWYGITVNYQMDGDYRQTPYTVYVDKLNLTYQ